MVKQMVQAALGAGALAMSAAALGQGAGGAAQPAGALKIGWAQVSITPEEPAFIAGQHYARVSEGVLDPITATALALETAGEHVIFVSCDLSAISEALRDAVRACVRETAPGVEPMKVILNATHTHEAPNVRPDRGWGVETGAMDAGAFVPFAAERIAGAVRQAWEGRAPGGISFGLGHAVVGHNRRWVNTDGASTMYGNTNTPDFSHAEGYEDHGVNLLCTYDREGALTGLVVNVACPSQVDEHLFQISADYWHETRLELRKRLGEGLFVLPQCSAAGDQSPHHILGKAQEERMYALLGRTKRQEIAVRIADAVEKIVPALARAVEWSPVLAHRSETVELPRRLITEDDVQSAQVEIDKLRAEYEKQQAALAANPALREQPRWYLNVSRPYCRMEWYQTVRQRFEQQKTQPRFPAEVHIVRLGDVVFATNPFEYYLDFGIYIKARSRATQTFLVQLAGNGTYVASPRSVSGGGYGSVPASNNVGPEGGRVLAERSIEMINALWTK